jgi:excisionase family DNA binding protein
MSNQGTRPPAEIYALNHTDVADSRRPTVKLLLTKKDVAYALSLSLRTVDNLIAAKRLQVRRIGRRVLIPRHALEQFARRDHVSSVGLAAERREKK